MNLSLYLDFTFILILAFCLSKKPLLVLENIFIFIITEFLISSYYGILIINTNVADVSQENDHLIIFRISEIITTPLLMLWFHNLLSVIKTPFYRISFSILFIALMYSLELLLVYWKVIIYHDWGIWNSFLAIPIILLISTTLHKVFRYMLRKEGIQ
ncbi:hypothetical protein ACFSO7_15630 [Bacillus sp. CGMCC 1.16607]|uniref:hypothetical protein n=1 Tax=Bacillus sp. CGMCC 1.16607 TaxID=3351842 RepID=UPI0036346DC9